MKALGALALTMVFANAHVALAQTSPKRDLPDYGRSSPPPNDAAWIPRVVLAPLWATNEFLVRRPLGAVLPPAERADVPRKIYDFFVFGPDHKAGILPVGFVEFGFRPSIGAFAFWDDAFFIKNNALRMHYEVWPGHGLSGSLSDRITFGASREALRFRVYGVDRPDRVFYGIGPSSLQSNQSRYSIARFDANATLELGLWRSSSFEAQIGVRKISTSHGAWGGNPSVEDAAAAGAFPLPYGFDRPYTAGVSSLHAKLDTRRRIPDSGFRIEAQTEHTTDLLASWVRYGAVLTGFIDLTGHERILSLSVVTAFVDPLAGAEIPFTELVSLGGNNPMHGYWAGRLIDRSAAVATVRYDWPIMSFLSGSLQASMGNVFGVHLRELRPGLFRFSGSAGLSMRRMDPPVDVLIGFGTDTFERGASIDMVRFSFGAHIDLF